MKLILASASPRRNELLSALGLDFEVIPSHIDEVPKDGETVADYVGRLSREKADAIARTNSDAWIIAADTVVYLDGAILEKPRDEADARRMLGQISGREHTVYSAVTLHRGDPAHSETRTVQTRVRMSALDEALIGWYVSTGEPMDKAGAYAVQGLGAMFIESINGNYTNVVGLPLPALLSLMRRAGINPIAAATAGRRS